MNGGVVHDPTRQTIVTQLFKTLNSHGFDGKNGFETNPNYTTNIWDTLTLAYLICIRRLPRRRWMNGGMWI